MVHGTEPKVTGDAAEGADPSEALPKLQEEGAETVSALNRFVRRLDGRDEEGTPLRGVIKATRIECTKQYEAGRERYRRVKEKGRHIMDTGSAHTAAALSNIGLEIDGIGSLRRKHPSYCVVGITALGALPGALTGGAKGFLRYGGRAFAGAYVLTYGWNWAEHRSIRRREDMIASTLNRQSALAQEASSRPSK